MLYEAHYGKAKVPLQDGNVCASRRMVNTGSGFDPVMFAAAGKTRLAPVQKQYDLLEASFAIRKKRCSDGFSDQGRYQGDRQ